MDDRLRREASAFSLRFTCEHCAHYDAPRRACANGYPSEVHRDVDLEASKELVFCKEFELR